MAVSMSSKGKKRAYLEDQEALSSHSPAPTAGSSTPKVKKPKRAETRVCPVCDEVLPVRLLATHAELESQRLKAIFDQVGSSEAIYEEPDYGPGPSLRSARSSQKVRKPGNAGTTQEAEKTIQAIKRHRKQRHTQFRELGREDERGKENLSRAQEIVCPMCLTTVRGDQDVLDAHVDACLANESRRLEEETLRALEEQAPADEVWEESVHVDGAAGHVGSVRGTGFHTRNRDEQDIEDDVDIDGDDGFGDIQFTEGDVLPISSSRAEVNEDDDVEIEGNDEESHAQRTQQTLRDLIAEGRVVRNASGTELDKTKAKMEEVLGLSETDKMDLAILAAKKRGDKGSMITALENKIKQLSRRDAGTLAAANVGCAVLVQQGSALYANV
ncbi:hypothetical protein C0989_011020 [Termitomyces sp. Mn162]|nr:hypothetical protein C0989_011020 [Termitomyces sp. Mn162]